MILRDLKLFLAAFIIALALFSVITILAQVPSYDQYLSLFTLGSAGTTENYFPNGLADILPGTQISWYVGVYNHMGTLELVRVVFKLLNSTMTGPNEVNNTASERSPFYEETRILTSNETWLMPISWSVLNATKTANFTEIHSLKFNGQTEASNETVTLEALHGYDFRMVIELWVYDEQAGNFSYVWEANGVTRSSYNQLWFNMTRLSLLP